MRVWKALLASALATVGAARAASTPTAAAPETSAPRWISTTSPYPSGCGIDLEATGFGETLGDTEAEPTRAMRSTDSGSTWSPAVPVAEFPATDGRHSTPFDDPETGERIDAPEWAISSAVAPDGTVYVAWRHASGAGTATIRFTKSPDGGLAWQAPATIADAGAETYLPILAVSGDGTVGATYYDVRRDVPGDAAYTSDLWFARSFDGGANWEESHLGGRFDLRTALLRKIPVRGKFLGDYHALVPLPGGFGVAFALADPKARAGASDVFFGRIFTTAPPGR
jgi:hypothetical protein